MYHIVLRGNIKVFFYLSESSVKTEKNEKEGERAIRVDVKGKRERGRYKEVVSLCLNYLIVLMY